MAMMPCQLRLQRFTSDLLLSHYTILNIAASDTIESMRAAREKYDPSKEKSVAAFAVSRRDRAMRVLPSINEI